MQSSQKRLWIATLAACVFATTPAAAAERVHRHGVGTLNLAIEGRSVEIELEAPGADIVGFEHPTRTDAQKRAVKTALEKLKDGDALFAFSAAARCRLRKAEAATPLRQERRGHDESHTEFHAHYRFECAHPERLTHLDTAYFKAFPNAQALEVQYVTRSAQGAYRLTPAAARLKF